MKSSLRTQVLIASFTALVIIGTGCERRGRAPVKATATTNVDKSASTKPGVSTTVQPPSTSSVAKHTSVTDADLIAIGKMDSCVFSIDLGETPSAATLQTDNKNFQAYQICQSELGVFANPEIQSSPARISSDGLITTAPTDGSDTMRKMFDAISKKSDDDQAAKVLDARVQLLKSAADQMIAKYASFDGANRPSMSAPGATNTVITDLKKLSNSAKLAQDNLKIMSSVSDGIDHAE